MREREEMKDLDDLVASAIIDGIKNNHTSIDPATNQPRNQLSSTLGIEDRKADGPKALPRMRTYRSDAEEAVEKSNASQTRISVSQYKQRHVPQSNREKKDIFIFVILLLAIGALVGVYFAYIYEKSPKAPVEMTPEKIETLIDYDEIIQSENDTLNEMLGRVQLENGITYIYNQNISLESIVLNFENIPDILQRNLSGNFMVGNISKNNSHSPFIILSGSYKFTLPGMQAWENNLANDMSILLGNSNFSTDIFLDVPNNFGIVRTNQDVSYGINKEGVIVITHSPNDVIDIMSQL